MKILVVDDDIDFADGMSELLELFGHDSRRAYSYGEAITAGTEERFDVALIDIGLGDRNGADCARELLEMKGAGRCILMSGYGPETLARMGVDTAAFLFLRKPVKPEELEELLKD